EGPQHAYGAVDGSPCRRLPGRLQTPLRVVLRQGAGEPPAQRVRASFQSGYACRIDTAGYSNPGSDTDPFWRRSTLGVAGARARVLRGRALSTLFQCFPGYTASSTR